ncbi:radical SAM protein, partial [bacterium]|nr:radical SAM protein [bacterium]
MKVVLLIPPGGYYAQRWRHKVLPPPLGLAYLGTVLVQNGIEVEIIDAHLRRLSWGALAERLRRAGPNIVGVSFTTETRFRGFHAINVARRALPRALIVAGGPHASLTAKDTLKHLPALDVIVRGEGEYTLLQLAEALSRRDDLSSIAGISFRRAGSVIHNPPREPIHDIDLIPVPDRRLLRLREYNFLLDVPGKGRRPAATLITSRGCPFGCIFCASSALWGKRVRTASPEKVLEELSHIIEAYGIRAFWFLDDTFTVNRERVERICELILKERLDIDWFCEARVDTVDEDLLRKMREAGCCRIGFGVESGSETVLSRHIAKPIHISKVRELASCCSRLGIVAHPFFILSHPGETYGDARKTFSLIHELEKDHQPSLSLLHIYPGTKLESIAKRTGILLESFTWSRRRIPGVFTLPALQGDVPIFRDQLTLEQIGDFLLEWAESPAATDEALSRREGRPRALSGAVLRILASVRSIQDIKPYFPMFKAFVRKQILAKIPGLDSGNSGATHARRHVKKASWLTSLGRVYRSFALRKEERCCHPPIRLWIELTNACNLKCIMCPQSAESEMPT